MPCPGCGRRVRWAHGYTDPRGPVGGVGRDHGDSRALLGEEAAELLGLVGHPSGRGRQRAHQHQPQVHEAALTPTAISAAQTKAQTMRAEGASTDDIYRMLATTLSPKIAGLLMETGNAETEWKSRVDSYMSERNNLRNNEALQQLRDTRFTAEEQHLLATYETSASPQLTQ